MSEKILGYILIAIGLVIILYSAFSVFSVFTAKSAPFELFKLAGISLDFGSLVGESLPPETRGQIGEPNLKSELVDSDFINTPLNIFAHLMLMGFLASIGFKIASLGVMMVRPIKVKLRGLNSSGDK